jgi:hypothetical protein
MIKRQNRPYLQPDQTPILAALRLGERTPVFCIGEQRLERFSWYVRIATRRPIDGTMTGIVRLETSTATGIDFAYQLADLTSAVLPRFATEWGRDPRAPQNLYPVAQLERELHHRLGDKVLIKRAIESALTESSTPLEWWVAIDPDSPRSSADIAPQPCIRWVQGPEP